MIFYRTLLTSPAESGAVDWSHHATLDAAHTAAKNHSDSARKNGLLFVEKFDVDTSKDGILGLLMGYDVNDAEPVLTCWQLTPRGGLKEVPVER